MMLCVDKKMLHESLPDHELGQLQAGGRDREQRRAGTPPRRPGRAAVPAEDQVRRDVLARVVRISGALNQRLAL